MYLIFDFDGTLVDSFSTAVDVLNSFAEDLNVRTISLEEATALKRFSSRELVRLLDIPAYKLPKVIYRARQCMRKNMLKLDPFEGIPQVLQALSQSGCSLGIVSSNSKENVALWLKHHALEHYFSFIHSSPSFFGKKRALEKVIKIHHIDRKQAFYIGDETRDIEAALLAGIASIAVTWGFNAESILVQYHPQFIAHTPKDLLSYRQI